MSEPVEATKGEQAAFNPYRKARAPKTDANMGNGTQKQIWTLAIKRAMAHNHGTVDRGLLQIAKTITKLAEGGNMWAIQHIADRIEGKVKEQVSIESVVTGEREDAARALADRFRTAAARERAAGSSEDSVH